MQQSQVARDVQLRAPYAWINTVGCYHDLCDETIGKKVRSFEK